MVVNRATKWDRFNSNSKWFLNESVCVFLYLSLYYLQEKIDVNF